MRLTKLSLIAAMLIGSTAFAIENTKVSGDVKLFYGTMDSDNGTYVQDAAGNVVGTDLFDAAGAYGNAAVDLELTTDLSKGVSAGVKATYVTTLGLENNLVDNTWSNAHTITADNAVSFASEAGGAQLDDTMFIGELWIAGTAFDTTAKVGRQSLDTPLAFTETWGIDQNTFEAAVLINQSIPDTTLVGAWVGKSNGSADDATVLQLNNVGSILYGAGAVGGAQAGVTSQNGQFNTFAQEGVYVAGLVNNSIKPLTVSGWYYSLQGFAEAMWAQADLNIGGILAGAQMTSIEANVGGAEDEAYAVMLGYEMKDVATIKVAYSDVDEQGATGGVGNVATTTRQSKLYTELWWAYNVASATGAETVSVTAEATVAGIDLFAGYYTVDNDINAGGEMDEIAITATKSFGPLDTTLAIINDDFDAVGGNDATHLQVYLTYNF
jgi:hypothetical protein